MKRFLCTILLVILFVNCAAFAEDGQNPAMNLIGDYTDEHSQRAVMHIKATDENAADVTIHWANSATEMVMWHFAGICDENDLSVSYTDCVKTIITTEDEETEGSEKIVYGNGTGKLTYNEDAGSICWQDDMEDAGKDCVFVWDASDPAFMAAGIKIDASESEVCEILGDSAEEIMIDGGKELVYRNVQLSGIDMEAHYLIMDDMVRGMRFVTRSGNNDAANSLSEFLLDSSNECNAEFTEEQIQRLGETYCGITDFTMLTYCSYYANDGTLLVYLRSSEKDIDLLFLDHMLQE